MGDLLLQLVWVAAHHGLRRANGHITRALRSGDAAPFPWHTIRTRQWGAVHDVTAALGNPPAPGGPR